MNTYPRVEINLEHLKHNVEFVVGKCREQGIAVSGVIKGMTGIPEAARMFEEGGAEFLASSRLEQIEDAIEIGVKIPKMLIRIPMLSEVEDVIRLTEISLNSELAVMEALNEEAGRQGKKHKVILMADVGDLREGFWNKDEMREVAVKVERDMENLELAGIGTNVGCYGSIVPSPEKLKELVAIAEDIEKEIGRKLDYISGGATSSFMRVLDGNMPERINHLRIGEVILLAVDLPLYYGYDLPDMYQDVFTLKAEVIEVKDKPTHPIGEIGVDAFGNTPEYVDRGIRRRALLAVGKVDYGSIDEIFPEEEGIEVLGASSDHTIIDVEDLGRDLAVGDIVSFSLNYASIVYVTNCRNVKRVFV